MKNEREEKMRGYDGCSSRKMGRKKSSTEGCRRKKIGIGGICLFSGMLIVGAAGCGTSSEPRENTAGAEAGGADAEQSDGAKTRALTVEELTAFASYVNERENNGFMLSVYGTPADINMDELFYSGAGMEEQPLSAEEKKAYQNAVGEEAVSTDITHLTTAQIDAFLQEKTGLSYSEMKHPLNWTYVEEYDSYYLEHGDTNYMAFECISGMMENEEIYTLRFRPKGAHEEAPLARGYHVTDCETVLKKTADGYQFVSNRMMNEVGQIAEQSFDVELAPQGKVTFASYEPDLRYSPYCDVTFVLIKNGVPYCYLPPMSEENMLAAAESFDSVAAVSFPDYNGDGYSDIITIVNYSYVQGPDAGGGYTQVRVYAGNEYGKFELNRDLSDMATGMDGEKTIDTVLERIKVASTHQGREESGL